jgi:hypothetical protein
MLPTEVTSMLSNVLGPVAAPAAAYLDTLSAQAASHGGLSASQGSSPEEVAQSEPVLQRAQQAAQVFLQQGGAPAAKAAHGHVINAAKTGARNAPPAGWTMQPIIAQNALRLLGYYRGPIDGIVGDSTKAAVKSFQNANPPLKVDGIVGVKTQPVLEGASRVALGNVQQRLQSAFGPTATSGAWPAGVAALKAAAAPALGGLLGGIFGSRWGRSKAAHHAQAHRPAIAAPHGRPPAWPQHMISGGEKEDADFRAALVQAIQKFPQDQGPSVALQRLIQAQAQPAATSGGWWGCSPWYSCLPARDWLANPMPACVATGYDPPRVAVGAGWLLPAALGAGAYAALDAYRWGAPHLAETVFGRYAPKVLDLTKRAQNALHVSAGLPVRMRAGIDTSTQGSPDLPPAVLNHLAASMKRAVV